MSRSNGRSNRKTHPSPKSLQVRCGFKEDASRIAPLPDFDNPYGRSTLDLHFLMRSLLPGPSSKASDSTVRRTGAVTTWAWAYRTIGREPPI